MIAELAIFKLFLLALARFAGLMVSAPILGSANFPVRAKVGLAAFCALIVTPTIGVLDTPIPDDAIAFAWWAVGEFLIGLIMGFVMTLIFSAIQIGGQIMDMQSGFGMMNVFNPALATQFPIFGFFLFILAVLYLLVLNGHHLMITGLVASYEHIPPGGFVARPALLLEIARLGQGMFIDGLLIAAPIAAAMLLAYVTLGLLGRVVPQIHLFVVGFPITIALALFITASIVGIYLQILNGMFYRMFQNVDGVMRAMG
jgi:flagellar biosynthetic protein FliR